MWRRAYDHDFGLQLQSWTKVLGQLCVSGVFSNSHRSDPSPHPQTMLDAWIQNFFWVSILYRVGGGRTARKFRKWCTVLRGNREMTEKYAYCSTVPRTFVHDCSSTLRGLFRVFRKRFCFTRVLWHALVKALHRYRRGQGFESRTSLNFFQAFFSQLRKLRI